MFKPADSLLEERPRGSLATFAGTVPHALQIFNLNRTSVAARPVLVLTSTSGSGKMDLIGVSDLGLSAPLVLAVMAPKKKRDRDKPVSFSSGGSCARELSDQSDLDRATMIPEWEL